MTAETGETVDAYRYNYAVDDALPGVLATDNKLRSITIPRSLSVNRDMRATELLKL